jgi:uncharacterized FlaG/YvyC family protein
MEITPLTGSRALAQIEPIEAMRRSSGEGQPGTATQEERAHTGAFDATAPESRELSDLTSRAGLELRFQKLPESNVTLIRMVEPTTGEVIREFPPEGLATVLAELRARAAHRLDRKA